MTRLRAAAVIVSLACTFGRADAQTAGAPAPAAPGATRPAGPAGKPADDVPTPRGALELSADGATLVPPGEVKAGKPAVLLLRAQQPSFNCQSPHPELGAYELVVALFQQVTAAHVIVAGQVVEGQRTERGILYTVPTSRDIGFIAYNLRRKIWDAAEDERRICAGRIKDSLNKREEKLKEKEPQRIELGQVNERLKRLKKTADANREELALVKSLANDRAVDRVVQLQVEYRRIEDDTADAEARRTQLAAALDAAVADTDRALQAMFGATPEQLQARLRELEAADKRTQVLKMGGILVGARAKAVYYDFAAWQTSESGAMPTLGAFPVIHQDDDIFAVVANVSRARHAYPFMVDVSNQAGSAINTTPTRPVFAPTLGVAADVERRITGEETAFRDVFLPVRGDFAPNDILTVSISTLRPDEKEGKPKSVTLVDKAKYPQVRALYWYNFNAGIMRSGLRDLQHTKVKIQADDPATKDVNEARYRTDTTAGAPQIKPVFAFTFYPIPVDIRAPVGWERFVPGPTVGFGLTHPTEDFVFVLSHELFRNTQFFWGWHWGTVDSLVKRNDVDETEDATAPPTRKTRERSFTFGLSFNLAVVTKIFQ